MTREEQDKVEFDLLTQHRKDMSLVSGIARQYRQRLELEIAGIEDILPYLPDKAQAPVRERLGRMRNIIRELQEKYEEVR